MKIDAEPRTPGTQRAPGGRQQHFYIGIVFEYRPKAVFDHHG
jgi:hypothetical protein